MLANILYLDSEQFPSHYTPMARKNVTGTCRICGRIGKLTFEHIPPEAAFNNVTVLKLDIEQLLAAQTSLEMQTVSRKQEQRGIGQNTLCSQCNSDTGAWYVPSYIEWARQGRSNACADSGNILNKPFIIKPLPIVKQILTMFASVCGEEFFANNHDLRRFVLNRIQTGLPNDLRIFAYYFGISSSAFRQSGISSTIDIDVDAPLKTFAEIAFPPFGYVLSFGGTPPPDQRMVDITFFAQAQYCEEKILNLPLPELEIHTVIPGDYRNRAEVDAIFD